MRSLSLQLVDVQNEDWRCVQCNVEVRGRIAPPRFKCGYKCPRNWVPMDAEVKPEWMGPVVRLVHDTLNEWPRYTSGSEKWMREKLQEALKGYDGFLHLWCNHSTKFGLEVLNVELTFKSGTPEPFMLVVSHLWNDPWRGGPMDRRFG